MKTLTGPACQKAVSPFKMHWTVTVETPVSAAI
jgi:hypothetical protein